jgi:hypothetical protein
LLLLNIIEYMQTANAQGLLTCILSPSIEVLRRALSMYQQKVGRQLVQDMIELFKEQQMF